MRTLGIYVQVPFCQTKCTYCNFHTGVVASGRFAPYVEAVCREIRGHRELLRAAGVNGSLGCMPGRNALVREADETASETFRWPASEGGAYTDADLWVDTVYIGGGTPSLLDPGHLQSILDVIRETFGEGADGEECGGRKSGGEPPHSQTSGATDEGGARGIKEVTLEADPETIDAGKAAGGVRAGINRVSFGLQSFSDKELVAAGRMHRRADIYRAVPILREAGIRNISFDLIAGLPHQTKESWRQSLDELAGVGAGAVSVFFVGVGWGGGVGQEFAA